MLRRILLPCLLIFPLLLILTIPRHRTAQAASSVADAPAYTADHQLEFPEHYREWVFLTSGVDMSYDKKPGAADHTMFNNVFVNPSAYKAYLDTGTWPDKTMLVLEDRAGERARSINTRGRTQSLEVMGLEIHVKDTAGPGKDLPGGWAFYAFDNPAGAKLIARPASCYTCHEEHAAVDTTFVQFYPTLVKVAEAKKTLSPAYLKEMTASAK